MLTHSDDVRLCVFGKLVLSLRISISKQYGIFGNCADARKVNRLDVMSVTKKRRNRRVPRTTGAPRERGGEVQGPSPSRTDKRIIWPRRSP